IWVGNLSFKTTDRMVRSFFKDAGRVTRVRMPVQKGGSASQSQNRGFAYVYFDSKEAKQEAISYSERELDGRRLLIKDGTDFSGRPQPDPLAQKALQKQQSSPGYFLFVGNLPFEATAQSLREFFGAHEQSRNMDGIGQFPDSGRCKGWALLEYSSEQEATAALNDPRNHVMDGRNLVVEFSNPEA
ncbi:uncharacterized protein EI90DRAFT_2810884, partial [Cantharellus anzutake]|uniref:uncharacterized protein n=1 Tax=Cantharellus anzutake TaxID=1750568 RepID=UPI001903CFD8